MICRLLFDSIVSYKDVSNHTLVFTLPGSGAKLTVDGFAAKIGGPAVYEDSALRLIDIWLDRLSHHSAWTTPGELLRG